MAFITLANTVVVDGAEQHPFSGTDVGLSFNAVGNSGVIVSKRTSDQLIQIADAAPSPTVGEDIPAGVAITGVFAANQPIVYALAGRRITGLTGLTVGATYYLGGNPNQGKVGLFSDIAVGDTIVIVGIAMSATDMVLILRNTGVVK